MLTMFTKISSEYLLLKARILTSIWAIPQNMWGNNELLQVYEQTKVYEKIMSYSKVYEQVSYYQSDNHELQ